MYLEALHKSIKYCYLEAKQCRRLDLSINALLLLFRDKFFERVIKITKHKKTSKLLKITSSHNKNVNISSNMIIETEQNKWIVISETELDIKYLVEKCNVICNNCILRCDSCNICVHTFKCSCIDNVLYFNICKHIHAIAKLNFVMNDNSNVIPLPVIDKNIILGSTAEISEISSTSLTDEINKKMKIMIGMQNRAGAINEEKQKHILKLLNYLQTSQSLCKLKI